MPWILDGNNLAGGRDRGPVRSAALALARGERVRLVVFFDGAPPAGAPQIERLGAVEVRYVPNADDAITRLVAGSGRGWRVATDDFGLAARVRAAGAEVVAAAAFWARAGAVRGTGDEGRALDPATELETLRRGTERLPDQPKRIVRRRAGRKR